MDLHVYTNSKIAKLPASLRPPALLLRNILRPNVVPYVYEYDGLATRHLSPFLYDKHWTSVYDEMASEWFEEARVEARWRMWMLTELALQADVKGANFAEFGVYRGGCAFMALSFTTNSPMFLFDTFAGIPRTNLSADEKAHGLGGQLSNTSVDYVEKRLSRWKDRITMCPGDIFETRDTYESGPLSFVHIDLNAAAPTAVALEYAYPRMVPGATVLFDDYGINTNYYTEQREVIDTFFKDKPETVIALPTGQAFVMKQG
jgi:O-methyltransferase